MKFPALAMAASAAALISASPAAAGITISAGNNPQPDEENVILTSGDVGTTIVGVTASSGVPVSIESTEQLSVPASGIMRIVAVDGGLNFLDFSLSSSDDDFADIIFDLVAPSSGSVTISAYTQLGGSLSSVFDFGLGQNFFTLVATGDDVFTHASFTSSIDVSSVSAIRVSGVTVPSVPEPASWLMMIVGFGAISLALRARKHAQPMVSNPRY